jgi:hypothetical protein
LPQGVHSGPQCRLHASDSLWPERSVATETLKTSSKTEKLNYLSIGIWWRGWKRTSADSRSYWMAPRAMASPSDFEPIGQWLSHYRAPRRKRRSVSSDSASSGYKDSRWLEGSALDLRIWPISWGFRIFAPSSQSYMLSVVLKSLSCFSSFFYSLSHS